MAKVNKVGGGQVRAKEAPGASASVENAIRDLPVVNAGNEMQVVSGTTTPSESRASSDTSIETPTIASSDANVGARDNEVKTPKAATMKAESPVGISRDVVFSKFKSPDVQPGRASDDEMTVREIPGKIGANEINAIPSSYGSGLPYTIDEISDKKREHQAKDKDESESDGNATSQMVDEIEGMTEDETDDIPGDPPIGTNPIGFPQMPPADRPPSPRFSKSGKDVELSSKKSVARKSWNGNGIYGKILGDSRIGMREVSIGTEDIREMLSQPGNSIVSYILNETGVEIDPSSDTLVDDVINAVNNNKVFVYTCKTPVNEVASAQKRRLKINHSGHGIKLHPMMANQYNADFDGDDMLVSFDYFAKKMVKDPMEYLIGIRGSVTLDPEFMQPPSVIGHKADKTYAMDVIRSYVLRGLSKKDKDVLSEKIVEYSQNFDEKSLGDLCEAITNVCNNGKYIDYVRMSKILESIYTGFRKIRLIQTEWVARQKSDIASLADYLPSKNIDDMVLVDVVDGLIEGVAPPNFNDIKVMMNAHLGEGDKGQNVAFRFTADIAKMFGIDQRITIGSQEEYDSFIDKLSTFAMSKRISRKMYEAEDAKIASEILRETVISRVGFPGDIINGERKYKTFNDFILRFKRVYEEESYLINLAGIQYIMNGESVEGPMHVLEIREDTIGGVTSALMNVYGNFSMNKMFGSHASFSKSRFEDSADMWKNEKKGSFHILPRNRNRSLKTFSNMGKLRIPQEKLDNVSKKAISENDKYLVYEVIAMVSDQSTSAASKFNIEMYGTSEIEDGKTGSDSVCARIIDVMHDLRKLKLEGRSAIDWVSDIVEMVYLTGPDMFAYFGMDNVEGFMESKYGKLLMKAESVDQIASIRMAMVVEYRTSRIENERRKKDDLVKDDAPEYLVMEADNRIAMEYMSLSSSSPAWEVIVSDMSNLDRELRTFDYIVENYDEISKSRTYLSAGKWWSDPTHDNVIDVLLDPNIGKELKCHIVSDMVKVFNKFEYFRSFEIPYMIELGSGSEWSYMPKGSDSIFNVVSNFDGRYNSYQAMTYDACVDEINNTKRKMEESGKSIMSALDNLFNSGEFAYIDRKMLADAAVSVFDKVYGQSEKSRQHPAANFLYNALALVRDGFVNHDVYRTDDRVIGQLGCENVSPHDILDVIVNGSRIDSYDEYGRAVVISRMTLFGKNNITDSDIWRLLESNPRLSLLFRTHTVSAVQGIKGKAYLSATRSFSDTMKMEKADEYLDPYENDVTLINDPDFLSIVLLMSKWGNRRFDRDEVTENIGVMYHLVDELANILDIVDDRKNVTFDMDSFLDGIGLSRDRLIDSGISESDADNCISAVSEALRRLANIVNDDLGGSKYPDASDAKFEFDATSVAMFFDLRQELNGAKTETSTSIEGTETWQMAPWISLLQVEDKFTVPSRVSDSELIELFGDCRTTYGNLVKDMTEQELLDACEKTDFAIEVPDGYVVQDKTSDMYGRQISSVNCYLMVKRDDGAEKYNLKVKKTGSDSLHRIVKYDRRNHDVDFGAILNAIRSFVNEDREFGLIRAKAYLASMLMESNENLGYDQDDFGNYMCIADLMILEHVDSDGNTEVYLRSIEQIATAIRHKMPYSIVDTGDYDVISAKAREIASTVGMEYGNPIDVLDKIRLASPIVKYASPTSDVSSMDFTKSYSKIMKFKSAMKPGNDVLTKDEIYEVQRNLLKSRFNTAGVGVDVNGIGTLHRIIGMGIVDENGNLDGNFKESVGMGLAWFVDNAGSVPQSLLTRASELGIDVMTSHPVDGYEDDSIKVGDYWIIENYDERNLHVTAGRPAIIRASHDAFVTHYEDDVNEFDLGDSMVQLFKNLVDRIKVRASKSKVMLASDMFSNTIKKYPNADISISLAEYEDVRKYIVDEHPEGYEIDYGVSVANNFEFHDRKELVDRAISVYRNNFQNSDNHAVISEIEPGDITCWAVAYVNDPKSGMKKVFSPIIPFDRRDKTNAFSKFEVVDISSAIGVGGLSIDDSTGFTVNLRYSDSLAGHILKIFEGAGAANKNMTCIDDAVDGLKLQNGIPIDFCVATPTTKNRRGGVNKRISTMESMCYMMRIDDVGYNFAENAESFPTLPHVRDALSASRIPLRSDDANEISWASILGVPDDVSFSDSSVEDSVNSITWSNNDEVNSFVRQQIIKFLKAGGNPSDYLACRFTSIDGGVERSDVFWEEKAFFNNGRNFQDGLLKYLHYMRPDAVPDGLEGDDSNTVFKIGHGSGYENECMQMMIPRRSADGRSVYLSPGNVYCGFSFFGNDFSGFHRPNVNAASKTLDSVNTMALGGKQSSKEDLISRLKWAMSDIPDMRKIANVRSDVDIDSIAEPQWYEMSHDIGDDPESFVAELNAQTSRRLKARTGSNRLDGRIIVAGSRDFTDYDYAKPTLERSISHDASIVSGGAKGADRIGERFAKDANRKLDVHKANWDRFGKRAGYIRNYEMSKSADAAIIFWDMESSGSKHMIQQAIRENLDVYVVPIRK